SVSSPCRAPEGCSRGGGARARTISVSASIDGWLLPATPRDGAPAGCGRRSSSSDCSPSILTLCPFHHQAPAALPPVNFDSNPPSAVSTSQQDAAPAHLRYGHCC